VGSTAAISYSSVGPRSTYSNGGSSSGSGSSQGGSGSAGTTVVGEDEINSQFDAGAEWVKVIVSLYEPTTLRAETDWKSTSSVDALRAEIAIRQASVLSTLSQSEFTLRHQYENQAAFSGEITLVGLDSLISHSLVQYVEPVRQRCKMLAQSIPLANAVLPRQVYDGDGVAVAIVDTGVDYTHPMLGGGGFPNAKVIGGYDTGENDLDPFPSPTEPHGTAVAGIAAGSLGFVGDYIGGVAYNAKIYALKADDEDGILWDDALLAAWDWCITNQYLDPANPIMVINNSWGGFTFYNDSAAADAAEPAYAALAQTAVNAGITILGASGNEYQTNGIITPAALSNVVSVGAVYDTTDEVTEYSNTAEILDILAPADPMYTTDIVGPGGYNLGDYIPDFGGTSSACPFAAGSVALMQSASLIVTGGFLSPDEVRDVLVATGDSVTDTKVAITKPRINLVAAMEIQDSGPIYVEEGSSIEEEGWWNPETMTWDPESHNLSVDDDPSFVAGPQGKYYLSQIDAGQSEQSPCVDAGSDEAHLLGMYKHTTRTDNVIDEDIIDMGYHYLLSSDITGDFDYNGFVDFCQEVPQGNDLYRFLLHWLDSGCGYPDWCHEKDLNQDGVVNFLDYAIASSECGFVETDPPEPDPMTWETPPYAVNSNTISMTATQAIDDYSGFDVEYYFECVSGPGSDSGWVPDRVYTDNAGEDGTFCYRVSARDAFGNETDWSSVICVTITGCGGGPGAPNPPSSLSAIAISNVQINLSWIDNSNDENGFRIERSNDGVNFTQIATVGANVTTYNNIGLQPNTTYWYRVRAYNGNGDSAYSNVASATTFPGPPPDTQPPPMPDPSLQWTTTPTEIIDPLGSGFFVHTMTAATITDATTGGNDPVEYYFECIDQSGLSSTWQLEATYTSGPVSIYPKAWRWRFKVRDAVGNESEYSIALQAFPGAGGG
jgi:hypothetical protein